MQKQIIASLIFLSLFFSVANAQQAVGVPSRQPDAFQRFELQRAEVELFKTLAFRYEIAWEEMDVQSMVDLRDGLSKLMEAEIKQATAKNDRTQAQEKRLAQQKTSLKKVKENPIVDGDSDLGDKAENNKSRFNEFIKLMEDDLSEQQAALRPVDKK